MRTCVGCGEHVDAAEAAGELVRIVRGPEGVIAVDARGSAAGRGAHVHARAACIEKAAPRGVARSFKASIAGVASPTGDVVPLSPASLGAAIAFALDRRIEGLVVSAVRSRAVAVGAEAASGSLERGDAKLAIVATDASAAADLSAVRTAVAAGQAVAWGTAARLGAMTATGTTKLDGVAVIGVENDLLAKAIASAVRARTEALDAANRKTTPRRGEMGDAARGAASGPGSTNHAERGA